MKAFFASLFLVIISYEVDAQNWSSLRGGIGNAVISMYSDSVDNYLYVLGRFDQVDGMHIKGIGRWDGVQWDSLNSGIDGLDTINNLPSNTYEITRYNNELYVCGDFSSLGSVKAKDIGKWNGANWDSISIQPNLYNFGVASTMASINSNLYVGGEFDTIAGIPANSIAKWDGNSWSSLNFPNFFPFLHFVYSSIAAICYYNGKIYVSGLIYSDPVDTVGYIMSYDGTSWQTVGGGIKGLGNTGVGSMVVYQNELYVAGTFSQLAGNAGNNIQRWNDTTWNDVGGGTGGTNESIYELLIYHGKLYAMGVFTEAGNVPADKISVWDGFKWCSLGSSFDNNILAGSVYNDTLLIGGAFSTIDGDTMNYIAKWTGGNFVDTCSVVGINEISSEINSFSIFPNPAKQSINIAFSNVLTEISTVEIFNTLGEKVSGQKLPPNTKQFSRPVFGWPQGIYLCRLLTEKGVAVAKFVKQ